MEIDCLDRSAREINRQLREGLAAGETEFVLRNPAARHNLAVGILQPCRIEVEGSAGYYCGGLCDGVELTVRGSAGWGLAENLMSGRVVVHGNAGSGAAATLRGGEVVVHGHAGARAGIAMKGGTLLIGGDAGPMTGFMMQKGTIVICGSAAEGLGDSLYEGRIFVAGEIAALGHDAQAESLAEEDLEFLNGLFARAGGESVGSVGSVTHHSPLTFQKIVSARGLYHFDRRDFARWRHAL